MRKVLWMGCLLLLTACAGTRPTQTDSFTPDDIVEMVQHHNSSLTSLHADGALYTSVQGSKDQAQFSYSLYKTDSLLLTIYGPFGIVVGKLQATPDNFYYFDALNNESYEGEPTRENFERILRIPLSQREMALLLRGEPPHDFADYRIAEPSATLPVFTRTENGQTERLVFSHADRALIEYSRKDNKGAILAMVRYSDFTGESGLQLAQKVTFQFPQAQISVNLQCRSIEPNVENRHYSFSIPRDVKRNRY